MENYKVESQNVPILVNIYLILMVNGESSGYMAHRYDGRVSPSTHSQTKAGARAFYAYAGIFQ
jgi:hypothetical protein